YIEESLMYFVGSVVATLAWMGCACFMWRDTSSSLHAAATHHATGDDVACAKCGHLLNGLREARCPECGEVYTLDRLFAAQQTSDL
ncbi:MAG: hypothetical protein AAGK78_01530, partial [Planctomycetota bacterium]